MTIEYSPEGVCAWRIKLSAEEGVVTGLEINGGCSGNSLGLVRLVEGMKVTEVIEKLEGIDCSGRGTSCPAQLALAAKELLKLEEQGA